MPANPGLRVSDVKTSDGESLAPRNTHHDEDDSGEDIEDLGMEPDPVAEADDDPSSASKQDMDDGGAASEAEDEPELVDEGDSEDGIEVYEDDEEFAF